MLLLRRESFEGENVTGRAKGGPAARERDGIEGYRGTVVVCGKSVHIIRCNRKEEISVGIMRRGTRGGGRVNVWEGGSGAREVLSATRTYMGERVRGESGGGLREDRRATQRQI